MSVSIAHIAKNSIRFSIVGLIAGVIGLPVTLYVASVLSPEKYGTYGLLSLWLFYASLISPGIISAGYRAIPVLLGQKQSEEAQRVQDISLTSQLLYTILPFLVLITASFFFTETVMKFGLIIVAASYATAQLATYWSSMNFAREIFGVLIKGKLIFAILSPVIIMASVNWIGVYSLLIAPPLASTILWLYYVKTRSIKYHFTIDKFKTWELVKVGLVLQLGTVIYCLFRFADRTVVASALPRADLGLYTYAAMFITYLLMIPGDFTNVLQPILWREAGTNGFKDTQRIAVYIALGTAILIPLSQLGYYIAMHAITKQYIESIIAFNILSYNLYLATVVTIPNLILTSSIVNKQHISLAIYAVGLTLEVALAILAVKSGYGIAGVAVAAVAAQSIVTIAAFIATHKHTDKTLGLYWLILLPFIIAIAFYFYHSFLRSYTNMLQYTGLSITAQIIVWGLIIAIFYRKYISVTQIKPFLVGVWGRHV